MAFSAPSFSPQTTPGNSTISNTSSSRRKVHLFSSFVTVLALPRVPTPLSIANSAFPAKSSSTEYNFKRSEKWRSRVSFFPSFLKKKGKDRETLKEELLEVIAPLDRGAEATSQDQEQVEQIASELEAINSIKEPLKSNLLNGKWELIYTTSRSILKSEWPKFLRPNGKIYQAINVDTLRAQNMETWPYFNQIPIKAPGSGRGELEITYLDEELRISRGDKGNLFVLKMADPTYRVPL